MNIIYGAGDYGRKTYSFLCSIGVDIDYFCQSVQTEIKELLGIPIISYEELRDMEEKKSIFISVANDKISKEIRAKLIKDCNGEVYCYEFGDFIKTNFSMFHDDMALYGEKYCIICDNPVTNFNPGGIRGDIFEKYHIIGGGYRENMICPHCKCVDRSRWALYVLENYTNIFSETCSVLHFAPENGLSMKIRNNPACNYFSGDIVPGRAQHIINVLDIPFKDETFDYIIINHVLEHIQDEAGAISELIRVLKLDGKVCMSFPICREQSTYENPALTTDLQRLKGYGQEDHVRLYGNDYKERLEKHGVYVETYSPSDIFTEELIRKYGFQPDDVIIICTKKG